MSEGLLVKYCSPTLAGIKTGNLFSWVFKDEEAMRECIRCWNRLLANKGLRIIPMKFENGHALIYVYRPSKLSEDLNDIQARALLTENGYSEENTNRCLTHLIKRLCAGESFPHEIGLFLGYPPEDVRGFIENHAAGYKSVGIWKVYGDAAKAEKIFARYKKCTDLYNDLFAKGKSIEMLTVAC